MVALVGVRERGLNSRTFNTVFPSKSKPQPSPGRLIEVVGLEHLWKEAESDQGLQLSLVFSIYRATPIAAAVFV